MTPTPRDLLLPTALTGVLMALYLLLRPYGDHAGATTADAAAAFADGRWVLAHVAGALALVHVARIAVRLHDVVGSTTTRVARWAALGGAVLVLPYYGAETFALHVIGRAATQDQALLALVPQVREQPVAVVGFALGLALLAVGAVLVALAWSRVATGWGAPSWAAWPLTTAVVLVLPQFSLPPAGRMAFGLAYLAAAGVLVAAVARAQTPPAPRSKGDTPTTVLTGS